MAVAGHVDEVQAHLAVAIPGDAVDAVAVAGGWGRGWGWGWVPGDAPGAAAGGCVPWLRWYCLRSGEFGVLGSFWAEKDFCR